MQLDLHNVYEWWLIYLYYNILNISYSLSDYSVKLTIRDVPNIRFGAE